MELTRNAQPTVPAEYHVGNNADQPDRVEAVYKRAGLPKQKLLARYRMRLDAAKKWRKDQCYDETWKRLNDLYRGKHYADGLYDEDRIAVNVAFSTINVIVPSVSVNYPQITVNPRQELYAPASEAVEAMLNYWWRHYDWREPCKDIVKDSLVYGHGWAKIGWKYETKVRESTPEEIEAQFEEQRQAASDAAAANPAMAADLPTDEDIRANLPTKTTDVVEDCPFLERVSPYDMLVDPEAVSTKDWKWVAQRLVVPFEEAVKDERYPKAARDKLKPDASTNPRWRDNETDEKKKYDDDVKRVTLWEFYDIRNKFYCVFAEHGEGFLIEPSDFPYPYGVPFVYLGNYDVPDTFYDLGDLEMIEPLQAELNAVRSDMRNHRKRYQRAHLALRDKFSPEAQATLVSNRDGRIVWIEGDENLQEIIQPLAQEPVSAEMYNYSELIERDIVDITGVSDYQRGSISETRRTATEAAIIQDASNARSADKLAQIETFIRECAERITALAQTYLEGEHVAHILGPDGGSKWVPYDPIAIEGEFVYEVEAGSTQPKNEMFRRQQAMQLVTALGPFVGTVVDPQALVTHLLREGFGVKNPERFLIDPLMQMLMQQQAMAQQEGGEGPGAGSATGGLEDGLTTSDPLNAIPANVQQQLLGQQGLNLENTDGIG